MQYTGISSFLAAEVWTSRKKSPIRSRVMMNILVDVHGLACTPNEMVQSDGEERILVEAELQQPLLFLHKLSIDPLALVGSWSGQGSVV